MMRVWQLRAVGLLLALSTTAHASAKGTDGTKTLRFDLDLPGTDFDAVFDTDVKIQAVPSTGAEDADLMKLRAANRGTFHTLLYTMGSPHVAMLGLRALTGAGFDAVLFGADELHKSPFAWWKAALCPGLLSVQYVSHFFDTNPRITLLLSAAHLTSDLAFWISLLTMLAVPATAPTTLLGLLLHMTAWVGFAAVHHYVTFPLTPALLVDAGFYLFLLVSPFLALFRVVPLVRALALVRTATLVGTGVEDAQAKAAVASALSSSNPLFDAEEWTDLYRVVGPPISEGSFGVVCEARAVRTNDRVALKIMKTQDPEAPVTLAVELAVAAYQCNVRLLSEKGQAAVQRLVSGLSENPFALQSALHEVKALRAVNALHDARIIHMLSAHKPSKGREATAGEGGAESSTGAGSVTRLEKKFRRDIVIATRFVDGNFMQLAPTLSVAGKLRLLQRCCSAVASMHAGGVVHRDLHPVNFAVSATDPTEPVILDLGIARLPGVVDPYLGVGREVQFPPEYFAFMEEAGKVRDTKALLVIAQGALGPPADVWAMGLHTIATLYGWNVQPVCLLSTQDVLRKYGGDMAKAMTAVFNKPDVARQHRNNFVRSWSADTTRQALADIGVEQHRDLHDLLTGMLHPDPSVRLTMRQAAEHKALQHGGEPVGATLGMSMTEAVRVMVAQFQPALETMASAGGRGQRATAGGQNVGGGGAVQEAEPGHKRKRLALLREAMAASAKMLRENNFFKSSSEGGRSAPPPVPVDVAGKLDAAMISVALATGALKSSTGQSMTSDVSDSSSVSLADVRLSLPAFTRVLADAGLGTLCAGQQDVLYQLLDEDGDGAVDGRELLAGLALYLSPMAGEATQLELAFRAFDLNRDSLLSLDELRSMLTAYGVPVEEEGGAADATSRGRRVDDVFARLDSDHSGGISFAEFVDGVRTDADLAKAFLGEVAGGAARPTTSVTEDDETLPRLVPVVGQGASSPAREAHGQRERMEVGVSTPGSSLGSPTAQDSPGVVGSAGTARRRRKD